MKKLTLILITLLATACSKTNLGTSQAGPVHPFVPQPLPTPVAVVPPQVTNLIYQGANNRGTNQAIQISHDLGQTFSDLLVPGVINNAKIDSSGDMIVAIGQDASFNNLKMEISTDDGNTFNQVALPAGFSQIGSLAVGGSNLIITNASVDPNTAGAIEISSDQGVSFQQFAIPTTLTRNVSIAMDETTVLVAGQVGSGGTFSFYKYMDLGSTYTQFTPNIGSSIGSMAVSGDWITITGSTPDQRNVILLSKDGGVTFTEQSIPGVMNNAKVGVSDGKIVAYGQSADNSTLSLEISLDGTTYNQLSIMSGISQINVLSFK